MRNVAFGLQARNQRAFIRASVVCEYPLRDDDESVCAKSITREMGEQRQVKSIEGESHGAAFVRIVDAVTGPGASRLLAKMRKSKSDGIALSRDVRTTRYAG